MIAVPNPPQAVAVYGNKNEKTSTEKKIDIIINLLLSSITTSTAE